MLAREDPAHRDAVPGVADHRGERRALPAHDREEPAELALHDERPGLALLLVRLEVADEALARAEAGDDQRLQSGYARFITSRAIEPAVPLRPVLLSPTRTTNRFGAWALPW